MVRGAIEAYEKGYADGVLMAEKMRWRGTPIGNLLKDLNYQPPQADDHRVEYDRGFKDAMEDAGRSEWIPPKVHEEADVKKHAPSGKFLMRSG